MSIKYKGMKKYESRANVLKEQMNTILRNNNVSSQLGLEEVSQEQFKIYKRLEFELYHLNRIIDFRKELEQKNVSSDNRGGKRLGAGRKLDTGMNTTTVRVPAVMKDYILSFVDLFAEWLKEDDELILKRKTNDYQIIKLLPLLEALVKYGKTNFLEKSKMQEDE